MKKISLLLLQMFVGFLQSAENQLALLSLNMEFLSEDELKKDLFTGIVNNKVSHVVSSVTQLKKINPRVLQDESFLHPNGYSPLAYAVLKAADESIIKYLLEQGASPLVMTKIKLEDNREEFASLMDILFEKTAFALLKQPRKNKTDYIDSIIRLLLYHGIACDFKTFKKIKNDWMGSILAANFNFYGEDDDEATLLENAINQNDSNKVHELLKKGALAKRKDYFPLKKAIYLGNRDIVKMLLDNGADSNHTDNYQNMPLYLALKSQNPLFLVDLLIHYGADVNYLIGEKKWNCLMFLVFRHVTYADFIDDSILLIDLFLKNNINVMAVDTDGNNVLHFAMGSNNFNQSLSFNIVKYLLDTINPQVLCQLINTKNNFDYTPLTVALLGLKIKEAELFIQNGGEVSDWRDRRGNTVFIYLMKQLRSADCESKNNLIRTIDIILDAGVDIFAVNNLGENFLHCMCYNYYIPLDVFKHVLDKIYYSSVYNINGNPLKKLINQQNGSGDTPLELCATAKIKEFLAQEYADDIISVKEDDKS